MMSSPGSDDGEPKKSSSRAMKLLVKVFISALLLVWLFSKTNFAAISESVSQMSLWPAMLAFVLLNVGQTLSSKRWQLLARPLGFGESYLRFRQLFYIGTFFNLFLPSSVGGDVVRAWKLAEEPAQRPAAFASVIADRVNGVLAMLILACAAVVFLYVTGTAETAPAWVLLTPFLACVGLASLLLLMPVLASLWNKLRLFAVAFQQEKPWYKALVCSFGVQLLATLQVLLLGYALNLPVPWAIYFVVVPIVSLLTMVPISLNGIGIREAMLVLLLLPYGVTTPQAITLAWGWLGLSLGVGIIGAFVYLLADSGKSRPEPVVLRLHDGKDSNAAFDSSADEGRAGQRQAAA